VVVWDEVQTLHIAQQMPVPLTVSCSSKSRLVLTFPVLPFWYLLSQVVLDIFQKSSKMIVCVLLWCIVQDYVLLIPSVQFEPSTVLDVQGVDLSSQFINTCGDDNFHVEYVMNIHSHCTRAAGVSARA